MRVGMAPASNRVSGPAALSAPATLLQNEARSWPFGAITPMPVMTTRRPRALPTGRPARRGPGEQQRGARLVVAVRRAELLDQRGLLEPDPRGQDRREGDQGDGQRDEGAQDQPDRQELEDHRQ